MAEKKHRTFTKNTGVYVYVPCEVNGELFKFCCSVVCYTTLCCTVVPKSVTLHDKFTYFIKKHDLFPDQVVLLLKNYCITMLTMCLKH